MEETETSRIEFSTGQSYNRSFVVNNLLSKNECDYIIDSTEKIGIFINFLLKISL